MRIKGSMSVEAAIIIPLFLFMICEGMKISINLYTEICKESEQKIVEDLWLVEDFYKIQIVNEVKK